MQIIFIWRVGLTAILFFGLFFYENYANAIFLGLFLFGG